MAADLIGTHQRWCKRVEKAPDVNTAGLGGQFKNGSSINQLDRLNQFFDNVIPATLRVIVKYKCRWFLNVGPARQETCHPETTVDQNQDRSGPPSPRKDTSMQRRFGHVESVSQANTMF